ncbi:hypothetical protein Ae505Ps2_2304c [Pseudonocardia sp. Ae505_Ps2]|nr:hypothetical protein Ae505Ps2_2304c [Pseudonocardia sp. Ae505_Ps2]
MVVVRQMIELSRLASSMLFKNLVSSAGRST